MQSETEPKANYLTDLFHDLRVSMRGEPHSLDEMLIDMDAAKAKLEDFLELLTSHHDYLRESIAVLQDHHADRVEKQFHLDRFLTLFDMHGPAEDATLYRCLVGNRAREARLEGLSGRDEHLLIYQLADELRRAGFDRSWSEGVDAKARVLAALVFHHLHEEEEGMFPVARREIPSNELNLLIEAYVDRCKARLRAGPRTSAGAPAN